MRLLTRLLGSGTNGAEVPPLDGVPHEEAHEIPGQNSSWDWVLTAEQIENEAQNGLIPMTMPADPNLHHSAILLWLAWQRHHGGNLRLENGRLLWLPVGRLGPIPVLGHFNPRHKEAEAPIASGYFQSVLLTPASYNQYYKRCAEVLAEYAVKPPAEVTTTNAPLNKFVDDLPVVCDDLQHALRFMLDFYALSEKDHHRIADLLERPALSWGTLPMGIRAAATFLCRRALVADLTLWQPTAAAEDLIPSSLRKSARALSEVPGNLWIGVQELLPDSAIDEINHHLPEGRKIHQVIYDTDTGRSGNTKTGTSFGVAKVVQQGSTVKKEQVTLTVDASIKRVDLKKPTHDAREIFKRLCWEAIELKASDLHIEPLLVKGLARVRIDGSLVELFECSEETLTHLIGAAKDVCGMSPESWDVQDKQFTLRINREGSTADFTVRVAASPVRSKVQGLVFRFLPKGGKIRKLDTLRLPPRVLRVIRHMIKQPQGLILFCGPTGSGKTSSIAACIDEINTPDVKIITIEDPVEYEMERVMQMQVDENRNIGFNEFLKSAMRLDPDIALLGEIRDKESADSAFRLAITGHLVFSTLHTLSSAKAPLRLNGWGVDMGLVAESLLGIVSQRLYPCLCPHCRLQRKPTKYELKAFHKCERYGITVPELVGQRNEGGCRECKGTGVMGSVAVMEALRNTGPVSELIARGAKAAEIEEQGFKQGDTSLYVEALRHVAAGTLDTADALKADSVWEQGWEENA